MDIRLTHELWPFQWLPLCCECAGYRDGYISLARSALPLHGKTLQAHKAKPFTAWPLHRRSAWGYQREQWGFLSISLGKREEVRWKEDQQGPVVIYCSEGCM